MLPAEILNQHAKLSSGLSFYAPSILRMVERAYSATPAHLSVSVHVLSLLAICVLSFSGRGIRILWTHF